jgi:LysM repeat protein
MKRLTAISFALLWIVSARAELSLHGAVKFGDSYLLSLSVGDAEGARWVAVGGEIGGYTVAAFDAERGEVKLKKGDSVIEASLPRSRVKPDQLEVRDVLTMSDADLAALGFHRIKAGDTGAKIARALRMTMADLLALNPGVNFTKLKVGQILVVSVPDEPNQSSEPTATGVTPPAGAGDRAAGSRGSP